jgi:hypothetical protein
VCVHVSLRVCACASACVHFFFFAALPQDDVTRCVLFRCADSVLWTHLSALCFSLSSLLQSLQQTVPDASTSTGSSGAPTSSSVVPQRRHTPSNTPSSSATQPARRVRFSLVGRTALDGATCAAFDPHTANLVVAMRRTPTQHGIQLLSTADLHGHRSFLSLHRKPIRCLRVTETLTLTAGLDKQVILSSATSNRVALRFSFREMAWSCAVCILFLSSCCGVRT